jgi:hypothetical protein
LSKADYSIEIKCSSVSKSNITDSGENNILTSAEKNVDKWGCLGKIRK